MELALYDRRIRELAADADRIGRLAEPDTSATAHSRLCGSRVTADICLRNGIITAHGHQVRACLVGQASAALLAKLIVGPPVPAMSAGKAAMQALLTDRRIPQTDPWRVLELFLPIADFPSRHGAALLPFEAVEQALAQLGDRANPTAVSLTRLLS
ncbi:MAG TPA: iron-sulfur cluster assembly scaffold protein [Roseomonas sp.]|nr:iron-sulfur cluster assembly scaffold protein [Roseomonas sp.]